MLAGAGTVALELLEDAPEVETIVVPVGGGGLVAGIAAAAPDRRVVAVEPERSTAVHDGLAAGKSGSGHPRLDRRRPLGAVRGRDRARGPAGDTRSRACSSPRQEIEEAFRFLYERAKLACEPAAAVGVAALLAGKVGDGPIAVVVSGGNVVAETASAILARR